MDENLEDDTTEQMEQESQYDQPVSLTGNEKRTKGILRIRLFSTGQRVLRALGVGCIGLIVTTIMIAIPLLHFVLVPLGLIATIGMVINAYARRELITGGSGECAYCGHEVRFVQRSAKFPFLERCGQCSRESSVNRISTPS